MGGASPSSPESRTVRTIVKNKGGGLRSGMRYAACWHRPLYKYLDIEIL